MLNNGRISESASIKLKKADPVLNKITWISNPAKFNIKQLGLFCLPDVSVELQVGEEHLAANGAFVLTPIIPLLNEHRSSSRPSRQTHLTSVVDPE